MPLLLCPNDNGSMTTVERGGVQFDMCSTCRGVWLDRGELEKLMAVAAEEAGGSDPQVRSAPQPAPPPSAWRAGGYGERGESGERGEYGERGERGERGEYGHGHRKKRSIFDIFD